MNFTEKFHSDLKDGQKGEQVIAHILSQRDFKIVSFNDNNEYDIRTTYKEKDVLHEIKTDCYEYYKKIITNNIFIETSCSKKLSGIWSTKADILTYYFPYQNKAYLIKVNILKDFIKNNPQLRRTTQSGDGGRVTGVLINKEEYKDIFLILDIPRCTKRFPLL